MDPNATLAKLRALIAGYNAEHDHTHPQRELVDAIADLDDLASSGILPFAWSEEREED